MKMFAIRCFGYSVAFAVPFSSLFAQTTQLLSVPDNRQVAADSGSGDSLSPIISPDGHYVLFASTANNLVTIATNTPIPAVSPSPLNVFLRDRSNATTTLASINSSGTGGGNDNSWPIALSTNGQYVLFESSASNLVSEDTNNATDVFVRDLISGQTLLVSVNTNGTVGNSASSGSAMTPDGHYVAFASSASDLIANDTNGIADIFVRDLLASNTVLVSAGALSASAQALTISPDISSDGRYVVFTSAGTNLVPGVQTPNEIYLRDLIAGTTAWASSGATQAVYAAFHSTNSISYNYMLSAGGQFVAYEASAPGGVAGVVLRYGGLTGLTDLVNTNAVAFSLGNNRSLDMTPDGRLIAFIASTNGSPGTNSSIFVWDAHSGDTTLASGDLNNQVPTNSLCAWPVLESTGRFVAFLSSGSGLVTDIPAPGFHLYVRDFQAARTLLIDYETNAAGAQLNTTPVPSLSADGRFIAFESLDSNIIQKDVNRCLDVFVRNIGSNITELISSRAPALPSITPDAPSTLSPFAISFDGRYLAFGSDADNLIANDTNASRDIFVRDIILRTNLLVSANTNNLPGNNLSVVPSITGDGRYVAFASSANDLVAGDTNRASDVFVRDLQHNITTLISINLSGTGPANRGSFSPLISTNGRFVVFHSTASDLVSGFTLGENLYLRDLLMGTTTNLTLVGVNLAAMTPDGRYIAFVGYITSASTPSFYVWDTQLNKRIYTDTVYPISAVALSPDGRTLAYGHLPGGPPQGLYTVDLVLHTAPLLQVNNTPAMHPGLRFSADGKYITYAGHGGGPILNQVFLVDVQAGTNLLLSQSYITSLPGNDSSDFPEISPDGRFVAYRSAATDILPTDTIGVPDILIYDNQTGLTSLLTRDHISSQSSDNRSLAPIFSADGKTLFFESSASDLVEQTFNFNPNIFAYGTFSLPPFPLAITVDTEGPLLYWPTVPGFTYHVQFKNDLAGSAWQDLSGNITFNGNVEYFRDVSTQAPLRFYRVKAF